MRLPNFENAIVDDSKLLAYCLDPEHKISKHKARVFQSALRINLDNFYILKNAILEFRNLGLLDDKIAQIMNITVEIIAKLTI